MLLLIDYVWLLTAESKGDPTAFISSSTPEALSDSSYGTKVSEVSHRGTGRAHAQTQRQQVLREEQKPAQLSPAAVKVSPSARGKAFIQLSETA